MRLIPAFAPGGIARRARSAPIAALVLLSALLVAGCVTTEVVRHPTASAPAQAPAVAEAEALARAGMDLQGPARQANTQRIAQLLGGLDDATLAREAAALPPGDPLYTHAGRALLGRGLPLPRPFDRGGAGFGAVDRPPAAPDGYRPPRALAVLLPLTGNLSRAAGPVRDGLLSGYYGEQRARPDIRFYDTGGTVGGAQAAYQRAVGAGADLVVGPLDRSAVDGLFRGALPVPVLALNRGDLAPPPGHASFALAPEEDGTAAADYLAARQARRVLVLRDGAEGARRASEAFAAQLQARGGAVAATLVVGEAPGDQSAALAAAAQSPGGVDALFLALEPAQAAALAPQLAQAGLWGKPRVATSQLADAGEAASGHALDGIAFPADSWTLHPVAGMPSDATAAELLPTARGPGARLFAFGHDAWALASHLDRLAGDPAARVEGATGSLRLDGFGDIARTPAWATYSGAAVVPLPAAAR